ncbi:hypothetical protein OF83DRAFT_1178671, partial [Amylostereum chailletii]
MTAQERAPIEEPTEKWWGTFTSELNIIRAHAWWKNPKLYHVASGLYQISLNATLTPPPTANRNPSPAPLLPPTLHFDPLSDESDEAKKSDASDDEGSVGGDLPDLPELPAVGGNTLDDMDVDMDASTVQGPPNAATVPQEDVAMEDAPGANQ